MSLSISPLRQPGRDEWATRTLAGVEDLTVLLLGSTSSREAESLSQVHLSSSKPESRSPSGYHKHHLHESQGGEVDESMGSSYVGVIGRPHHLPAE